MENIVLKLTAAGMCVLLGSCTLRDVDLEQYPGTLISNGDVELKAFLPDPENGLYRATRFDWSGVIGSVQYKGHEYFGYWKETHDPLFHEDLSGPVEGYIEPGLGYIIPMATCSGAIDPSVVFYLHRARGMALDEIEHLLNYRAGLLGVSMQSADIRELIDSTDPGAMLAIDLFVYHVVCAIGSLAAALGGLDVLVFTAGIGENSTQIRERICEGFAWMGLQIDPNANARHGPRISTPDSNVSAWVIPTNEELMIAKHTLRLINRPK